MLILLVFMIINTIPCLISFGISRTTSLVKMSRFSPFNRIDLLYRSINGVPIEATILIPAYISGTSKGCGWKLPTMVRRHGGGFILGDNMYEPWFAYWLPDLTLHAEITLNYRLLPESTGIELLNDVAHFLKWLQVDVQLYME